MNSKKIMYNNIKVIRIIRKCCPNQILLITINSILKSFQSIVNILLFKYVFNMLSNNVDFYILSRNIILIFLFNIFILIINIYIEQVFIIRNRRIIVGYFQKLLLNKSVQFELECFERVDYYDEFRKSKEQVENRIENIQDSISNFILSIFGIGAFVTLIFTMEPIIIIFSLLSVMLSLILNKKAIKYQHEFYEDITTSERKIDYYFKVCTQKEYAKEVRIFSKFIDMIKSKFSSNLEEIKRKTKHFSLKYSRVIILQNIILQIINLITLLYISRKVFLKYISLGDFIALTGGNQKLIEYIGTFLRVFPEMYENGLYLENLFNFLEYEIKITDGMISSVDEETIDIELSNVSYKYPNTNTYAIKNINMKIKNGEKVAIVGENGAGKSTLVKLICRLYDSTEGVIKFQGNNYKDLKVDLIKDNLSVLFQDYNLYSLTVIDNILMRYTNDDVDLNHIKNILKKLKIYDRVKKGGKGLFAEISREFNDEGLVLSGGEEQRMAISRIFAQNKKIYVFDEPLSKIDPVSEHEIFDLLLETCKNKTLILISHHLSNLYKMDRIYFLDDGIVAEEGTHKELMLKKGLYYNMYIKQIERYDIKSK